MREFGLRVDVILVDVVDDLASLLVDLCLALGGRELDVSLLEDRLDALPHVVRLKAGAARRSSERQSRGKEGKEGERRGKKEE